ncbi:uncharacterized protein LOC144928134 isoform X2 [Branchiostoma floridae x Branchiostoma belcheri]
MAEREENPGMPAKKKCKITKTASWTCFLKRTLTVTLHVQDITEEWRHHPAFAQLASVSDTNDVGEFDTRLDIHELGDNLGARDLNQVPNINDVADWIDTRLYIKELGDNLGARDEFIPYDDEGEGSLAGSLSSLNSSSWGDDQNHLS